MKIERTPYDLWANILCIAMLAVLFLGLALAWENIPDRIPLHYNAAGEIDRLGNKDRIWTLPVVAGFLYLIITLVERFPAVWNTGVRVTEENKARVYRILKDLLNTVKLVLVVVISCLTAYSAAARPLPGWFTPLFLVLMFGPVLYFIIKLYRAR